MSQLTLFELFNVEHEFFFHPFYIDIDLMQGKDLTAYFEWCVGSFHKIHKRCNENDFVENVTPSWACKKYAHTVYSYINAIHHVVWYAFGKM